MAGIRYENKARANLGIELENCTFNPAFRFKPEGGPSELAIPDALAFSSKGDILTIVEIKVTHTNQAYRQLNNLYLPIIRAAFPQITCINLLEMCKNYDPTVRLPGHIRIVERLDDFIQNPSDGFGIYIWSGR